MSTIRVIYRSGAPGYPATDQHMDAVRYTVHSDFLNADVVVDAIGGTPSTAEIDAILNPPPLTASQIIDAAFPQTGTARVLFEALFSLSNQVRQLRTEMNAELVARSQPAAYPNNATEGGAAQITKSQLKSWLESKLP